MSGKGTSLALLAAAIIACSPAAQSRNSPAPAPAPKDTRGAAVFLENRLSGTPGWSWPDHGSGISGYAVPSSVDLGGEVSIAVSTASTTYDIDVYRIGWYSGSLGRLVRSTHGLKGRSQGMWEPNTFGVIGCPTCRYDARTGLLELQWGVTYAFNVPASWISGDYVARLSTPAGDVSYAWFVVRDDHHSTDILAIMPLNTYQAYNNWGGKSLYPTNSFGPPTMQVGQFSGAATQVSMERPYANWSGGGIRQDFETVEFLERDGYDVAYATSTDLDRDPYLLDGHRVILFVGHDEYWSRTMRDRVEAFRDTGTSLVFLGGNDVYWQVRYGRGRNGSDRSVLICYRFASIDPVAKADPSDATVHFSDAPLDRPSTSLTGTIYTDPILQQPAAWVVAPTAPAWLLAGTSLAPGRSIAGLVGVECDSFDPAYPVPSSLVIVSDSPVVKTGGARTHCNTVYYRAPSGAQVFSAGTWSWEDFIAGRKENQDVVTMTRNVLAQFGVSPRQC